MRITPLTAVVLLLVAGAARADTLLLKDGRIVDGRKMERTDAGVKIKYEAGEVLVPKDLVEDVLIEGAETAYVPQTDEEKAKFASGLVPFEGRWVTPKVRATLIAKKIADKRAELEAIRTHAEWRDRWKEATEHFGFEYTVPPHVFAYYRDMMEAYFREFGKVWKVSQPKELGKLTVCFYTDLDKFAQVGGAGGGVRGYFKFVAPMELNFYYDRVDPRFTEEVMFHETNHYLQLLLEPKFSMPHFPGESLAEYYGASVYDPEKKQLTVGLIQEGRLADVKSQVDTGEFLELKKMLETDGMYEHYSWGWTFVHFLMTHEAYAKKFEKWVLALPKAKDIVREAQGDMKTVTGPEILKSFMRYMGLKSDEDLKALEKEWHAYVKDELKATSGRGLAKAAREAMDSGRRLRATRLFKEAIEAGDREASTFHEYGRFLRTGEGPKAGLDEAILNFRKAIELDPLIGRFYATLADALSDKETPEAKEEAKKLAKLSVELDPDDMWLAYEMKELLKRLGE